MGGKSLNNPTAKGKKNGQPVTNYQENFVTDEVLQYTVRRAYNLFHVSTEDPILDQFW
jgi:hypothetical protein